MSLDYKTIKNKTVVITGAAQGIGYQFAERLLENGAKIVILLDIDEDKVSEAAQILNAKYGEKKAVFYKCDVTEDIEEITKAIIDTYNNVDVLVNSAGVVNESSAKKTMSINVVALMEMSMKFFEHMRTDTGGKGGTIINLSSLYGILVDPFLPFYKASKFAVVGFSRTLGHEMNFNKYGVRVIVLCPGFTDTGIHVKINQNENMISKDEFRAFSKKMPWQTVEDLGKAAMEIFKIADSGTAWSISGGEPFTQLP